MEKKVKKILFLLVLLIVAYSYALYPTDVDPDPDPDPIPTVNVYAFFGSYADEPEPYLAFKAAETDTASAPWHPVMFMLPNPDSLHSGTLISIKEYVDSYGDYLYKDFLPTAIEEFWASMFNENSFSNISNMDFHIVNPPVGSQSSEFWVLPFNQPASPNYAELKSLIVSTLGQAKWDSMNVVNNVVLMLLPSGSPYGSTLYQIHVNYRETMLNETTAIIAHELGHKLRYFEDEGIGYTKYNGIKNGQYLGANFSTSGPYDLMHENRGMFSQYHLYGIPPYHTNDLIRNPSVFGDSHLIIEKNDTDNYTKVRLNSIRRYPVFEEVNGNNGIRVITIPFNDIDTPIAGELNGNLVCDQKFLIELRGGTGFDNIAPMYKDGESKGVLISHIIQDNHINLIDIECAVPFPEGYRNHDSTWVDLDDPYDPDYNGQYYFGKPVNDWLDDHAPNNYILEGGKHSWYNDPDYNNVWNQSLPTDFFNDSDRNKFTPYTRPSTRSWKDNETNIAVFIDNIESNYADLRIYRNYHSTPLTGLTAKELPDGSKGLQIMGDGYIGENFFIAKGFELDIGGGNFPVSKTTLVPNTNMYVEDNGFLLLMENATLCLESSTLNMKPGSQFMPGPIAKIELKNSELNFNYNSEIHDFRLDNYEITSSGQSSFYNSNFNMKGASLLTLNEGSVFTLKSGTKFNIPAGASLILGKNSELVIESGSELTIDPNAVIQAGEGAKITIRSGVTLALDGVTINGSEWAGINALAGSSVDLNNVHITGAATGVSGLPFRCVIQNSTFDQCESGIAVEGCDSLLVKNNILTGTGSGIGSGISVTQKDGWLIGNTISGFRNGITAISSTPNIFDNTISGNRHSGLYVAGLNALPVLIKPVSNQVLAYYLNNKIFDNGYVPDHPVMTIITPGQICVLHHSNIMMKYGHNNVYSNPVSAVPEVPCLVAATLFPEGEYPRIQILNAEGTYWGASMVNSYFFRIGDGYGIDYDPWHSWPWGQIPSTSNYPEPDSKSYDLLLKALNNEYEGKYDKAISEYEKIIKKYPDSEEAAVAYAKLPGSYSEQNLGLDPLISLYDEQLSSADENVNKKFFKEMKVTTHLKAKDYDAAIALSEEMKLEADSEEEKVLCSIDIAIANLLKDSGKGSKNNADQRETLKRLYAKLGNGKTEPASITESVLPSEHTLYQNYPNPFNPITQIRFDLAKSSNIKLSVYNINGQLVSEPAKGVKNAGYHVVDFDGSKLNSGIYYYTLEIDGKAITKKMVLIR